MSHVPLNGGKSGMNEIAFDSIRAEWTSNRERGEKHKFIAVHYKGKHTGNFGGCIWTTLVETHYALPANHYLFFARHDVRVAVVYFSTNAHWVLNPF